MRGHKARHNLACLLQDLGRQAEAEWVALADEPGYVLAHLGLADLFHAQGHAARVEQAVATLRGLGPAFSAEAAALADRRAVEAGDYARARADLEAAAALYPDSLPVRVALSHAVIKGGGTPAMA